MWNLKLKEITKIISIHPLENMSIHSEYHGNLCINFLRHIVVNDVLAKGKFKPEGPGVHKIMRNNPWKTMDSWYKL